MTNIILAFIFGGLFGWIYAHQVIATECQKLGKFYVGKSVFTCTEKRL